jgi:hypothetical protein
MSLDAFWPDYDGGIWWMERERIIGVLKSHRFLFNFIFKNRSKINKFQHPERYDTFERKVFWATLIAAPLFWILLVSTAFLTLQWQWMVVAGIGAGMTLTNLYGYLRCKWNSTQEMTNYFTKWAFLSVS